MKTEEEEKQTSPEEAENASEQEEEQQESAEEEASNGSEEKSEESEEQAESEGEDSGSKSSEQEENSVSGQDGKDDKKSQIDYQKSYEELHPKFTKATQELSRLRKFHDENASIIQALDSNPEILQQLLDAEKSKSLTAEDIDKRVEDKLTTREKEQSEIKMIQDFANAREEFKSPEFRNMFIQKFDETGMNISEFNLSLLYDKLTYEKQIKARQQEAIEEKKKKDKEKELAAVGGNGESPAGNPLEKALFGGTTNPNNLL